MSSPIKEKTLRASIWSLIDNICSQGFAFLVGIVLARLLSPSDYGAVGVLAIFLALANVFVDCGFGNALIRKIDRSQEDLSTAFYFNICVGIVSYLVLFLLAPLIASFFSIPILTSLLRVLALCIVFYSLSIVQNSILIANLRIQTLAIINVCTQIPTGCVAIYFAYKGFGVWALVIQQVGASFFRFLWLWIIAKWKPSFCFSRQSFFYLYNFGWKLLGTNLLGTFFNEIYGFVIGRFLGASELGFYAKSKQLSEHPRTLINNVVNRVVLPIMVETQGDKFHVRHIYSRLVQAICFITFPVFGFLIVIAEPLIVELWTNKWSECILLFQLFCVGMAFGPLSSLNFCLLQLLNRTDIMLKLELIKKPICLILLLISIPFGLRGIVLFATIYNIVGCLINMMPTRKLISYSITRQAKDILDILLLLPFPMIISYLVEDFVVSKIVSIIISAITFFIIYILICQMFRISIYSYLINSIKFKFNATKDD